MTGLGILAKAGIIEAQNTVVANCGQGAVALLSGGDYDFKHCTIANFWYNFGIERKNPSLVLGNYFVDTTGAVRPAPLVKAYFGNCIIYGNNETELVLDSAIATAFNYKFDHCLMKLNGDINTNNSRFVDLVKNPTLRTDSTLFKNYDKNDYRLLRGSPAIDRGDSGIGSQVPNDINGVSRIGNPDIGAYEKE